MERRVLLEVRLPPKAEAAGLARRAIEDLPHRFNGTRSKLQLAVTELVANAVRHGAMEPTDEIRLVIREGDHHVRVEVTDPGRSHDEAVAGWNRIPETFPGDDPTGHFGLFLVQAIGKRAGITSDDGTTAWVELDAPKH